MCEHQCVKIRTHPLKRISDHDIRDSGPSLNIFEEDIAGSLYTTNEVVAGLSGVRRRLGYNSHLLSLIKYSYCEVDVIQMSDAVILQTLFPFLARLPAGPLRLQTVLARLEVGIPEACRVPVTPGEDTDLTRELGAKRSRCIGSSVRIC